MTIPVLSIILAACAVAPPGASPHPAGADTVVLFPQADALQEWSDDVGLSSPAHVVASGRHLMVLDGATAGVWQLDRSSGEPTRFGGAGQGPGEVRMLGRAVVTGDTLWISDVGNARVSAWHDAEVVGEWRMEGLSANGEFLVLDDIGLLYPQPATSSELIDIPGEWGPALGREQTGGSPLPLDLLAWDGSRIAVFENSAARLVTYDPSLGSARDYLPFTSITPDGDCFIAGHPLGVSRWCP
jgi:hypothetical protein